MSPIILCITAVLIGAATADGIEMKFQKSLVTSAVGHRCKVSSDCKGYPKSTHCNETSGLCSCLKELFAVPFGDKILCITKITDVYQDQIQRQIVFGDVPIGQDCRADDECKGYPDTAHCNDNGMCWCFYDFLLVPIGDELVCLPRATQVGQECRVDPQCQQGVPGSLSGCFTSQTNPPNLVCNCTETAIHQPPNHRCYPRANHIGDGCTVNTQCTVNLGIHSECSASQKVCICKRDAIPNYDGTKCLPLVEKVGEECVIPDQCRLGELGPLSDCVDNEHGDEPKKICNCTDIAIHDPDSGTDWCHERLYFIGESCLVNAQCTVNMGNLSQCSTITHKCDCKNEGVSNNNGTFCLLKATHIGEQCSEPQQCTDGKPGPFSNCSPSLQDPEQMVCACTDEGVQEPGQEVCLRKAERVNDPCSHSIQCTSTLGDLSECPSSGRCSCLNGSSIPSNNRDACLRIVDDLGDDCTESIQCQAGEPGGLSICVDDKCSCAPDAASEPGDNLCRPRAGFIGGDCTVGSQCKSHLGDLSECIGGKCNCTPTYGVPSGNRLRCLAVINFIGGDCEEPQQCQNGTPGRYSDCLPSPVFPGGKNICNCTSDAIHQPGEHECLLKADHVGALCEIDAQCQTNLGELSECSDSVCSCIEGRAIPNRVNTSCIPIVNIIGDLCEEAAQCHLGAPGNLSDCTRSNVFPYRDVCNCTEEAVREPGKHICLKKAVAVADDCEFDGQCVPYLGDLAECSLDHNKCMCKKGSVANTNYTYCIPGGVLISKPCYDSQQCVGEPGVSSVCTQTGVCDCLSNFVTSASLDDCLPVRQMIGDGCTERQQCQQGAPGEHSSCLPSPLNPSMKVCNCTPNSVTEAGRHKCHLKAEQVGEACEVNIQCYYNLDNSHCLGGSCRCLSNYTASSNGRKCLPKSLLDLPCIDNSQCAEIDHAECNLEDSKCMCVVGFMAHPQSPNTCIPKASLIGDSCSEDDDQCFELQESYCNQTTLECECHMDTHVGSSDNKSCLEMVNGLHEVCLETGQCGVDNSECRDTSDMNTTTCQCIPEEFVESVDIPGGCLQVVHNVGEPCEDNIQCVTGIDDNAQCILGSCRCAYPYSYYKNKCYIPSGLGGYCSENEPCELGANELAYCHLAKRTCECEDPSFQEEDLCWLAKFVGDSCTSDIECTMTIFGPVRCDKVNKTCTCFDGYWSDFNGALCSSSDYCIGVPSLILIFVAISTFIKL